MYDTGTNTIMSSPGHLMLPFALFSTISAERHAMSFHRKNENKIASLAADPRYISRTDSKACMSPRTTLHTRLPSSASLPTPWIDEGPRPSPAGGASHSLHPRHGPPRPQPLPPPLSKRVSANSPLCTRYNDGEDTNEGTILTEKKNKRKTKYSIQ